MKNEKSTAAVALRRKAERKIKTGRAKNLTSLPDGDILKLVHELEVHQIELKMQNEELQQAIVKAEDAAKRYADLYNDIYNFSPAGYFNLAPDGTINNLNHNGALMLGKERDDLIKSNFRLIISQVSLPVFNQFLQKAFVTNCNQTCEINLDIIGKPLCYVFIEGRVPAHKEECLLTVVDITRRKKTEEALIENEVRFKTIFDHSTVAIYETDLDGKYLLVNKQWCKFAGMTPDEARGDGWQQAIHADDRDRILKLWNEHANSNNLWNCEYRFCTPDQKITWVMETSIPLKNEQGDTTGYLGMNTDITERKQMEEELRSNYTILRISGKAAKFGGWVLNLSEKKVIWSDEVAAIHEMPAGYSPTLQEGINFYAPEWKDIISGAVTDCAEKDIPFDKELELITAKNKRIWVRAIGEAVKNQNGKIVGIHGAFQDISERKFSELKRRESESKYRRLHKTMNDGFVMVDMSGRIIEFNQPYQQMLGYSDEEIYKLTYSDFTPEKWHAFESKIIDEEILPAGFSHVYEKEYIRKDGTIFPVELRTFLIKDEKNENEGMWAIVRDITDRKKTESIMLENEARLRELNATKDKFFSIIAHDLKNPFNSIIGFSNILAQQVREIDLEEVEEYAEIIQRSSRRAMDLLTNLLEWSRLQTGRIQFHPEHIDLVELIERESDLLSDTARLKLIEISKKSPKKATVFVDKSMIGTALRNLISNAIKFSHPGDEIVISVEQKPNEYEIAVIDKGVGIKEVSLGKLFHIEESYTTAGTQNEKGTGLGLILCKEFIEKHKGKIWVESEFGKGSTFRFTIPLI